MKPINRAICYSFKGETLRLKIRWAGMTMYIATGFSFDRTPLRGKPRWDGRRCVPTGTYGRQRMSGAMINASLENLERAVSEAFLLFESEDRIPGKEELRAAIMNDGEHADLWEAYAMFVADGSRFRGWSLSTIKSVSNVGKILKEFDPGLKLETITQRTLTDFSSWMGFNRISPHEFRSGSKGYSNSTIAKHLRTFRWFLAWATDKGMIRESQWKSARGLQMPKRIKQPIIFLTPEEVKLFEESGFLPGSEEREAVDFFLFCCFSGLRYSDAADLRKSSVREDCIEVVTKKTADPLRIDLNRHTRRILNDYAGNPSPYALPRITLSRLNHLLKVIAKALGIDTPVLKSQFYGSRRIDRTVPKWELLSSHCARRTFICQALALGIPPHIVMKWTGHSEWSAMQPYIDVAGSSSRRSMDLFD